MWEGSWEGVPSGSVKRGGGEGLFRWKDQFRDFCESLEIDLLNFGLNSDTC